MAVSPRRQLTLLVPGLLGFSAGDPQSPPQALQRLLARAELLPEPAAHGPEEVVFRYFAATPPDPDSDLPVAAVTRLLDLAVVDNGWWLRADPVHLIPDRDRLVLADASRLDITQEEANQLIGEIAEIYKPDGWLFKAPRPGRWYIKPPHTPRIRTTPLADVIGRDIHPSLPTGPDGKIWHAMLNEVQILLHTAKANEDRERAGKLPINSLWFWGGGRLPNIGAHSFTAVWSAEPVTLALSRLSQTPSHDLPRDFDDWQQQAGDGVHLVAIDTAYLPALYRDFADWRQVLEKLERTWFEPLLPALKSGAIDELRLVNENGKTYWVTRKHARRWWRRRRPLEHYRG
jgi:hypothetical protein